MKIIIFDTDNDFEMYVLKPNYEIFQSDISGTYYYDAAYTDQYNKDIEDGVYFCIDCPDSKVRKHKCVARGMIMKDIDNILPVTMENINLLYPNAEIINYKKIK